MYRNFWNKTALVFSGGLFVKFILFDIFWCIDTTFASFSYAETYLSKLLSVFVLSSSYLLFRYRKVQIVILLLVDLLLVANLWYFRTYYTAIPLSSYALADNLTDFMASVLDSFRWNDLAFPFTTCLIGWMVRKSPSSSHTRKERIRYYWIPLCGIAGLLVLLNASKGGFRHSYQQLKQSAYLCSSSAPLFTVFGCLYYDLTESEKVLTPAIQSEIRQWMTEQPSPSCSDTVLPPRKHCLVIIAESFESWVLEQKVNGQEITPCLNELLKEPTTLYAPRILTQVKGGRSIDAQLMICAGLLPLESGAYCSMYADNHYYTLPKAMKEFKNSRNYLLTIDKVSTWNQGAVAKSFGIDTIISYPDFRMTEAFGTHKRIGDVPFFQQCQEKIAKGEIWKAHESSYIQFVTYSGHAPFKLPEHLRTLPIPEGFPEKAGDYLTTAHYTDRAIGQFIDFLKTLPQYQETLVVITGDHEGLATDREELCHHPLCQGLVGDKPFVPFIVINSPVGRRYEQVMGQIDIYPTLLELLQLDGYCWKGLGSSILHPEKEGVAVGSQMQVEGNNYSPETVCHLRQAHHISDLILRFDYFATKKE